MKNNESSKVRIKSRTCDYFDDIIKFEDFNSDKILIDEKSHKNILIYYISYKTLIGEKPLRIMVKVDIKQIFHAFLFNIRNHSPEVSEVEYNRSEVELNIILPKVNNFDIKQKSAWNIRFIIYPKHQTKCWQNGNKAK